MTSSVSVTSSPSRDHRRGLGRVLLRLEFVLGGRGLQLLQLQFHLIEQALRPFGTGAINLAAELLDLQLLAGYHRLGIGLPRPRHGGFSLGRVDPGALGQ
jgi:hypothetical protein